jgi:dihydrofolate synthase / folylpolyglutamate synthase
MNVQKIKSRKIKPPKDNIEDLLAQIPKLKDGSVVTISSKVVSICEGNTVPIENISHEDLVNKLADLKIEPIARGPNDMILTQIGDLLVESSGVDVSNSNGYYVLLPKDPFKSAQGIWRHLKKRDGVKRLGVIISDSHSVPRRSGAIGFAIASYGFRSTNVYEDKKDIFGKRFNFTATDVADSLAAASVLVMGEGGEMTPIAVVTELENIKFFNRPTPLKLAKRYSWVNPELDVYAPLLDAKLWKKPNKKSP